MVAIRQHLKDLLENPTVLAVGFFYCCWVIRILLGGGKYLPHERICAVAGSSFKIKGGCLTFKGVPLKSKEVV